MSPMNKLEAWGYVIVGVILDSPIALALILAAAGKTDMAVYWACVGIPPASFGSLLFAHGAAMLLYNTKQ